MNEIAFLLLFVWWVAMKNRFGDEVDLDICFFYQRLDEALLVPTQYDEEGRVEKTQHWTVANLIG